MFSVRSCDKDHVLIQVHHLCHLISSTNRVRLMAK